MNMGTRANDEYKISVLTDVIITKEDIVDVMDAAGYGINGWADAILHVGDWLGEDTCEHLANGGTVKIRLREPIDDSGKTCYEMDREMLLKGIKMWMSLSEDAPAALFHNGVRYELDTGDVDGESADEIIQYALFGELVFG